MAIDMIEKNELGALASSRLGQHQFADENKQFKNFTGPEFFQDGGEDWANLFGSQLRKKHLAENKADELKNWNTYPENTCDELQKKLDALQLRAETLLKLLAASPKDAFYPVRLQVVRDVEGKAKAKQLSLDCVNIKAKEELAAQQESTLKTITSLSEASIQSAKTDLLGINPTPTADSLTTAATANKKFLIYGGIGVGFVILVLLLRRK